MGRFDDLAAQRVRAFQKLHGPAQPPKFREVGPSTLEHAGIGAVTRKNVSQIAKTPRRKGKRLTRARPPRVA